MSEYDKIFHRASAFDCSFPLTGRKIYDFVPRKGSLTLMNDKFDLHTHTLASGHAYSTLAEMIQAAASKGLVLYGCTDHAPAMPGTLGSFYFQNFKVIPRKLHGIQIIMGAELNILDPTGKVDLPESTLARLDYGIASIHPPCYSGKTMQENTSAYLKALENPFIQIIGHPDDGRFPTDYETLAAAAAQHHKLLEVNNSSLSPRGFRANARQNYQTLLEYCRKYKAHIILDSDAHICFDVGNHSYVHQLLEEMDFPEDLVVNTSLKKLAEFLPEGIFDPE